MGGQPDPAAAKPPALAALFFEFFGLEMRRQRFDERLELAFHHLIELMQREADAVIRHAILREVVGADLFAAVARCPPCCAAPRRSFPAAFRSSIS